MTEQEYWQEVEEIARQALSEPRRSRTEWIEQTVDGHQYVIYTHEAREVLRISPNEDAVFDENGAREFNNFSEAYSLGALYAMLADVREKMVALEEEAEEDEEDLVEDENLDIDLNGGLPSEDEE